MKKISPKCSKTIVSSDSRVWKPANFEDFLIELEHIIAACPEQNQLFRGHADSKWLLESTFVRTCKKILIDLEPHARPSEKTRESFEYIGVLLGLLLLKYDVLIPPSQELQILERDQGIDAMFELMKRIQQYPEEDRGPLKGTFFLDWTKNKNVGLYFANFDANRGYIKIRKNDGALFICDLRATGKTLMRKDGEAVRVQDIIDKIVKAINENKRFGCPLLFYPPKQIGNLQANRQDVVYWAQMDLAYDLEDFWKRQEVDQNKDERIFMKLILPNKTQNDCEDYLNSQSPPITHRHLFPEERS